MEVSHIGLKKGANIARETWLQWIVIWKDDGSTVLGLIFVIMNEKC